MNENRNYNEAKYFSGFLNTRSGITDRKKDQYLVLPTANKQKINQFNNKSLSFF